MPGIRQLSNTPQYTEYDLLELYQVLNSIDAQAHPEAHATLEQEIAKRSFSSAIELENCLYVLDREKYPELAGRLFEQIEDRGGLSLLKPFEVTDENRYQTFWPRVGANMLDSLVVGMPIGLLLFALQSLEILSPENFGLVNQLSQFAGLAYPIVMHALYGQTLGKMAAKVKLIDVSEKREVQPKQALVRDIVPVFFACVSLAYFLGFSTPTDIEQLTDTAKLIFVSITVFALVWSLAEIISMLFSPKRRALHDLIAGTVVVRVP